jgi:UDP-glucose 4-epimerase
MNIGSTENITIEQMAYLFTNETGIEVVPVYDTAQEADARHTHADVFKPANLIGYEPSKSILVGVSRLIDWYRANRDWYQALVIYSTS